MIMTDINAGEVEHMIDLDQQDADFAQVWQTLRDQTATLGAGRPLLCDENRNENRSY